MSKLLQVVKSHILKPQRILWTSFEGSKSQHSTVHISFRKAHHLFEAPKTVSRVTFLPAPATSTLAKQVVSTQNQLVYKRQLRRQYHTIVSQSEPHPSSGDNKNKKIKQAACGRNIFCNRFYSDIFHKYQPVMDVPEGLFRGNVDRFSGITVDSSAEYETNVDFAEKLKKSIEFWQEKRYRGVWFKIQTQHADWIPHLTKQQFDFHHAKTGHVVMFRWLPTDEYVNIPQFAHTMIGVGCLVVNSKNEVLVVSERYALIPNSWKLPGGYVEPRENLIDAAIREVLEETGVDCEFKTVVSLRHSHRGGFGCSDMYVVVALTPLNEELKRCEREIAKIQWMPISEYLQHPNVHETNRHFVRTLLDYNQRGISFTCEQAKHQILQTEYSLYYMKAQAKADESSANLSHI